jgi:hypothetical protein
MHNVWVLNVRAQPPVVVAQVAAKERKTLVAAARALAAAFPGPEFTLVHQIGSQSFLPAELDGLIQAIRPLTPMEAETIREEFSRQIGR